MILTPCYLIIINKKLWISLRGFYLVDIVHTGEVKICSATYNNNHTRQFLRVSTLSVLKQAGIFWPFSLIG